MLTPYACYCLSTRTSHNDVNVHINAHQNERRPANIPQIRPGEWSNGLWAWATYAPERLACRVLVRGRLRRCYGSVAGQQDAAGCGDNYDGPDRIRLCCLVLRRR
jgi:hypothetical protein